MNHDINIKSKFQYDERSTHIQRIKKLGFLLECNEKRYQWNNQNCAYFSLYFLLLRSRKHTLKTISKGKFGVDERCWNAIPSMIKNLLPQL